MRVRALTVLAVLPMALVLAPATAHAQRLVTPRCWSSSDWRSDEACNRSYDAEVARAARREATEERARLRAIDNADRVARNRMQRLETAARARDAARMATARAEERAWRNNELHREQAERARERVRERQAERSRERAIRYRSW